MKKHINLAISMGTIGIPFKVFAFLFVPLLASTVHYLVLCITHDLLHNFYMMLPAFYLVVSTIVLIRAWVVPRKINAGEWMMMCIHAIAFAIYIFYLLSKWFTNTTPTKDGPVMLIGIVAVTFCVGWNHLYRRKYY